MKPKEMCKKAVKFANELVNIIVLTVVLLLLAFALYALWDSNQLHQAASKSQYAAYKPTPENEGQSFMELQAINPEVFAWLTVFGTGIDYPVAQGHDNMKYVNTSAMGVYSLTGSIFLDYSNSTDFNDFNSIMYGHHMEKKKMFGEIGSFSEKSVFNSYRYGNLYFDGKDHGLEFFAFIHADAYDRTIFAPNVTDDERQAFLDNLLEKAMYKRDIGVTTNDHIALLSTCSSGSTNGRDILVGKITDEIYEETTTEVDEDCTTGLLSADCNYCLVIKIPLWAQSLLLLVVIVAARLIAIAVTISLKKKQSCRKQKRSMDT